ncbi:MAG: hypothetical protein ACR2QF_15690 [Geminicoccaceae bacterium]
MTQSTVTRLPAASTQRSGSASRSSSANDAGFATSMTAVVTINVSDTDKKSGGDAASSTTQATSKAQTADDKPDDVEIEIEITTLEGNELAENLSVTSNRGDAEISITANGDIGVSTDGFFYSDTPEVQIGETLTFTVPEELVNVQGATINVSNLVDDKTGAESALVTAYDAEGKEVFRCVVEGNDAGKVTVDIDVSFSKVDFKPVDNGSWTLSGNSDFTIERIDIKTGDVPKGGDPQHNSGGFLANFYGFFEQRNYRLQSQIQRQNLQSFANISATCQSADHRQADDAKEKGLGEQDRITQRTALDQS